VGQKDEAEQAYAQAKTVPMSFSGKENL